MLLAHAGSTMCMVVGDIRAAVMPIVSVLGLALVVARTGAGAPAATPAAEDELF